MEKKNIIKKILGNIYVKNIFFICIVFVVLVILVLVGLHLYTKHNESVDVPAVKGLQIEDAIGIFSSADLKYEIVDSIFQTGGVPGAILEQNPKAGSKVKKGRLIYLTTQAKNRQMIEIPSLQDYSLRQAEAQLNALGFSNISIEEVPSAYKGIVLSISYRGEVLAPGQKVPKGAALRMTVGAGGEIQRDSVSNNESPSVDKSFFE